MTQALTDQEIVNHPDYAHLEAEYRPDYARAMVEDKTWRAAKQAAAAQRKQDRAALWSPAYLPTIPFLQSLYDAVLARSERRMPKWKFRLAADLMLEIQPKLARVDRRLFHWTALQCRGVDAKLMALSRNQLATVLVQARNWVLLSGTLADGERDSDGGLTGFISIGRRVSWARGLEIAAGRALRERIDAAFRDGRFNRFTPDMLGPHCLICGKALTDPVSQARFIGPECFGTSSVHIPWLLDASAPPSQTGEPH